MSSYPGFIGPSAPSQSLLADCERSVNWYQEIEGPQHVLYPTPGEAPFIRVTELGGRALFSMGRTFAVMGTGFYELFSTGTTINRGTVAQDNYPATISYNGVAGGQLFITSGSNGYCYDLNSNLLSTVLTGEATMGGMIDGYFLAFNIQNSTVRLSDLNDGSSWDPTQFFQRSIAADPWQGMVVSNRQAWLPGSQSVEIWFDTGAFPQPFAPYPGAFFMEGTPAPFSVAAVGSSLMWLTQNADGSGRVVRTNGYMPTPVSSKALETAIARYRQASSISDAEALVYQDRGHLFYCLNFPTANATWVFDDSTNQWHERGSWNEMTGAFDVWRPRVHCHAFGKHLVGDRTTGAIGYLDANTFTQIDGSPIRRVRIPPAVTVAPGARRLVVRRLTLLGEPGVGATSGQGATPAVMLRISRDGGKTWGAEHQATTGALGNYENRTFWTRLGTSSRSWVPEISVSDPVWWPLIDLDIEASQVRELR